MYSCEEERYFVAGRYMNQPNTEHMVWVISIPRTGSAIEAAADPNAVK